MGLAADDSGSEYWNLEPSLPQHQRRRYHRGPIRHHRSAVAAGYIASRPDGQDRVAEQLGPATQWYASGTIGANTFEKPVVIGAHETLAVVIDKSTQSALSLHDPKLWWPNGYGNQELYDFSLRFVLDNGEVSDLKTAKIGIRKFTYNKDHPLTIFCNGQKIMLKALTGGWTKGCSAVTGRVLRPGCGWRKT